MVGVWLCLLDGRDGKVAGARRWMDAELGDGPNGAVTGVWAMWMVGRRRRWLVAMGSQLLAGQGGWLVAGGNGWSRWIVGQWLVLGEVDGWSVAGAGRGGWMVAGGNGWSVAGGLSQAVDGHSGWLVAGAGRGGWSVAGGDGWSRWMVTRWLVLGEVDGRLQVVMDGCDG